MVLEHVLAGACAVIKLSPAFHVHRFCQGDLDVGNRFLVPGMGHELIIEAQVLNGLNDFLAQIMVNAVNLILIKGLI